MQISNNIEAIDLALWIKDKRILIVSDIHLGLEESMHLKGIMVPKQQSELIIQSFKKIFTKVSPRTIIINGDLKHNFGKNLKQEWDDTLKLIDFLKENCRELVFIKGNHDNFLKTIANQKNIKVVDEYLVDDTLLVHGDKLVETKAKSIIIGHEHPAISLKEKSKIEKFKCFLKGKYKNKELIVMPSFNPLSYGSDILNKGRFSPFLKDISNFEVFIVGDKGVLPFGKVKNLKQET